MNPCPAPSSAPASPSGADLIGWKIVLDAPSDHELKIEIAGWDEHDSLATNGPPIGVYALQYTNQHNELVSVCPDVLPGAFAVTLLDHGALCLDRPRFVSPKEVAEECALPSRSTISPSDPRIIWQTHTP